MNSECSRKEVTSYEERNETDMQHHMCYPVTMGFSSDEVRQNLCCGLFPKLLNYVVCILFKPLYDSLTPPHCSTIMGAYYIRIIRYNGST